MTTTTRAAVLRSLDGPFEVEEVTLADLGPREVLVEIVSAGMCHTDLAMREAGAPEQLPIILGHEGAGVVKGVGVAVQGIAPGDHVVLSFASCGRCEMCRRARPAYCQNFFALNTVGRYEDGSASASDRSGAAVANRFFGQSSFAKHVIAHERCVVVVDDDLPLEILGPLGCGIQTGAGAVLNEMRLQPGQSIAVFGAGGVGLAAVMAAKLSGASDIVVVDLHESRLDLARELGATRTVLGSDDDVAAQIMGSGPGVDFVFETTAVASVMLTGMSVLRIGGLAVLVNADPTSGIPPVMLIGRRVTFSFEGDAVPQLLIPQLLEFWRQGRFPFDRLIRSYPLDEINIAEADSKSGAAVKPVLLP